MSVKQTTIPGALSVPQNATIGGELVVQGKATFNRNLSIKGWLDAPNIKAPCKGLYKDYDSIEANYPRPQNGWFCLVNKSSDETNIYVDVYIAEKGQWVLLGEQALEFKLFLDEIEKVLDTQNQEISSIKTLLLNGVIVPSSISFNVKEDSVNFEFTSTSLENGDKAFSLEMPMLSDTKAGMLKSSWYQSLKTLYTLYSSAEKSELYLSAQEKDPNEKGYVIMNFLNSDGIIAPTFLMSIATASKAGLMPSSDKAILDNIYTAWKDAMAKANSFSFSTTTDKVTMTLLGATVDGTLLKVSVPYPMVSANKAGAIPASFYEGIDFIKSIFDVMKEGKLALTTTTTVENGEVTVHFVSRLDDEETVIGADFTMSLATASKAGLMSSIDKERLDSLYKAWEEGKLGSPTLITQAEIDEMLSDFTFAECKGSTFETITQAEIDEMLSNFTFGECKGASITFITQAEIDEMLSNFTFAECKGGGLDIYEEATIEEIDALFD